MHQKVTFTMCSSVCFCKSRCFISVRVEIVEMKGQSGSVRVSQHFCGFCYGPLESVLRLSHCWPYSRTTSVQISSHLKCLFSDVHYSSRPEHGTKSEWRGTAEIKIDSGPVLIKQRSYSGRLPAGRTDIKTVCLTSPAVQRENREIPVILKPAKHNTHFNLKDTLL